MTQHSLIFVHGMGVEDPDRSYQQLWLAIAQQYELMHKLDPGTFKLLFRPVFVEYEQITIKAKQDISKSAFPWIDPNDSSPFANLNLIRQLRHFITFALGDVTAYVSDNDNNIRSTFWQQIEPATRQGNYSIIAHSLGSVIAFDFLYHLLHLHELFIPNPTIDSTSDPTRSAIAEDPKIVTFKQEMRDFDRDLKLIIDNFRNFYSFGSTIGLFMMRQSKLWQNEPTFADIINPIRQLSADLTPHTWLNFYDRQDVLSYPLEHLFERNSANSDRTLTDVRVETGDLVINSHLCYWENIEMATAIAKTLP